MYVCSLYIVSQRGSWYTRGNQAKALNPILKDIWRKNGKTFTNVEFHGENNEKNRNVENLMTTALWEFFWLNIFNPLIMRITMVCMLPWQQ